MQVQLYCTTNYAFTINICETVRTKNGVKNSTVNEVVTLW